MRSLWTKLSLSLSLADLKILYNYLLVLPNIVILVSFPFKYRHCLFWRWLVNLESRVITIDARTRSAHVEGERSKGDTGNC